MTLVSLGSSAQTSNRTSSITNQNQANAENTVEGIEYLGKRLLFQVKKRMNLTEPEEEKMEEEERKKKVKIRFLGIEIES
jgi:hypothetical protein